MAGTTRRLCAGALLAAVLFSAAVFSKAARFDAEEGREDAEYNDNVMLLTDDAENGEDAPAEDGAAEEGSDYSGLITDDDIDRMGHEKGDSSVPGPAAAVPRISEVFAEFTPEKVSSQMDPKANALYQSSLEVLGRKRWAVVDFYDLRAAYKDMEEAAKLGHLDALKIMGFSYLFGESRWSIDEARNIFEKLAETGSPDAHLGLGFIYSTGLGLENPDPARGLLHYTISALGGNALAQMAMGYRYHAGINVKADCNAALTWYRRVAQKVADKVKLTGAPSVQRIRIPDEVESTSNSGSLLDNNVFSYYSYLAETGDVQATLALAQLFLTGGKGVPMDLEAAAKYFQVAAEAGNAQAYAYLGRMYLEGTPSTPQNNRTAYQYFKRAADKGNAIAQSGLGLMFLNGYGMPPDLSMAYKLFNVAAEQGSSDGQLHLGQMYFHGIGVEKNYKQAIKYFQLAAQSGHILALYNLAYIHASGVGVTRSCALATDLMKNVAERGRWAERFVDAFMKFQFGHTEEAAVRYLFLAELGYEVAQTNFAFLLDKSEGKQQLFDSAHTFKRALQYWHRSANQEYAFARVKLGDYSFYGLGTDVDFAVAANQYKAAGTVHQNPQALFNLAYMHEQGLGVNRDLHLAKRYYDQAAETSTDAIVPVTLALIKLRFLFFIDYFVNRSLPIAAAMEFFDDQIGPNWDLYLMSVFLGLFLWLTVLYLHYRRQHLAQAATPSSVPRPPPETPPAEAEPR